MLSAFFLTCLFAFLSQISVSHGYLNTGLLITPPVGATVQPNQGVSISYKPFVDQVEQTEFITVSFELDADNVNDKAYLAANFTVIGRKTIEGNIQTPTKPSNYFLIITDYRTPTKNKTDEPFRYSYVVTANQSFIVTGN